MRKGDGSRVDPVESDMRRINIPRVHAEFEAEIAIYKLGKSRVNVKARIGRPYDVITSC